MAALLIAPLLVGSMMIGPTDLTEGLFKLLCFLFNLCWVLCRYLWWSWPRWLFVRGLVANPP
jgi:hypothetical protein